MTSITMILIYLKYHVFNFLLDSHYQEFNKSNKPLKPIKNYYLKKCMLIIFYDIFFFCFMFVLLITFWSCIYCTTYQICGMFSMTD